MRTSSKNLKERRIQYLRMKCNEASHSIRGHKRFDGICQCSDNPDMYMCRICGSKFTSKEFEFMTRERISQKEINDAKNLCVRMREFSKNLSIH